MLSIKGTFRDGVAFPAEVVDGLEGRSVIITFLDESRPSPAVEGGCDDGYDALSRLIEETQVETGIGDLAHQHDHYLYGTTKNPSH